MPGALSLTKLSVRKTANGGPTLLRDIAAMEYANNVAVIGLADAYEHSPVHNLTTLPL
jgi:hypothetical protein